MKLVLLAVGFLVLVFALVWEGVSVGNEWAAVGLFLFSVAASGYFLCWPVSRDDQQRRRFNPDFVWLFIYVGVAVISAGWFLLLMRA